MLTALQPTNPQQSLETSPLFRLSLSSKELFHSNFLEWLSTENRDAFRKLINKMAGLDEDYSWGTRSWFVKREFRNFDLCVVAGDSDLSNNSVEGDVIDNTDEAIDDDDLRILFVIENKVKSIPYKEQLIKYAQRAEKINKKISKESRVFPVYVLLTLAQSFPDRPKNQNPWEIEWTEKKRQKEVTNKCKWHICSYKEYFELLKQYYLPLYKQNGPAKFVINDYIIFIENLTSLAEDWADDCQLDKQFLYFSNAASNKKFIPNYSVAKKLRIHDLYQKQKFSALCTDLYNTIKQKYGNKFVVFPSNQGGLFKDKFFDEWGYQITKKDNYICVNYTYLHGEPLLEINIHPACDKNKIELYYAIQVQGDAYEHGIQVKKIPGVTYPKVNKGRGKGTKDDIAKHVWENVLQNNGKYQGDVDGWMTVSTSEWKENSCFLSGINPPEDGEYYRYIQSDGAYLYQKRTIDDKASIRAVITKMLDDLDFVISSLEGRHDSSSPLLQSSELAATGIKNNAEAVINKYRQGQSGDLAHFIRQCESSEKLEEGGLKEV